MTLALSPAGRRYGYKKDSLDHRDFGVARIARMLELGAAPPRSASNLSLMGPVIDQKQQGSCTAHTAVEDREFLHWKEYQRHGKPVTPGVEGMFSPSFVYYQERLMDGTLSQGDCGSMGRTSCRVLNKYGCALRSDMPYTDTECSLAPTGEQLADAATWPAGAYHRLTTVEDMKSVIASGYNFRVGFTVYESFESDWSTPGYMPLPKSGEGQLGGHEVLAIGYDDDKAAFLIRNSWGASWGLDGNFWFPYQAAADPNVLQDSWHQHLGRW